MDYLTLLGSINKIALFCFIATLGFVIYEFVMFLKDRAQFKNPEVPQFDPSAQIKMTPVNTTETKTQKPLYFNRKNRLIPTGIAVFFLMVFAGIMIFYAPKSDPIVSTTTQAAPKKQNVALIAPTDTPSQEPTTAPTAVPTETLLAMAVTNTPTPTMVDEDIVVAEASATATIEPTVEESTTETLPMAGVYQYLFILALVGSSVVIISLLF